MTSTIVSKKYEFTNESFTFDGIILHRIRALRDFADVKAGSLGGFIESEDNLSHEGNCWVYDNACVVKSGRVYENARVFGNAITYGRIYGHARVYDNARIANNVHVCENAHIHGIAVIRENVGGSTEIKTYIERLSPYGELEIVYVSPKIKQHN
ncbi:hypothetical protein [Bartonella massiliensis]|uniref:hypothetical protein n=1 Tax=Bartonella massiliensis TaxID=929795 RepID=UPI001157492F|nr:hypothetical protein [Bartonella massiliensis]